MNSEIMREPDLTKNLDKRQIERERERQRERERESERERERAMRRRAKKCPTRILQKAGSKHQYRIRGFACRALGPQTAIPNRRAGRASATVGPT